MISCKHPVSLLPAQPDKSGKAPPSLGEWPTSKHVSGPRLWSVHLRVHRLLKTNRIRLLDCGDIGKSTSSRRRSGKEDAPQHIHAVRAVHNLRPDMIGVLHRSRPQLRNSVRVAVELELAQAPPPRAWLSLLLSNGAICGWSWRRQPLPLLWHVRSLPA